MHVAQVHTGSVVHEDTLGLARRTIHNTYMIVQGLSTILNSYATGTHMPTITALCKPHHNGWLCSLVENMFTYIYLPEDQQCYLLLLHFLGATPTPPQPQVCLGDVTVGFRRGKERLAELAAKHEV